MISLKEGEKTTAKKFAADLLVSKIGDAVEYWTETADGYGRLSSMSEKERAEVLEQLINYETRLIKILGYVRK